MLFNYNKFINENKYTKKNLNPKFWDKSLEFNKRIRDKIITIVDDFYENLNVDIDIYDVRLTGSMANFNYTEDSDLDIHIIFDFDEYEDDTEILSKMMELKAFVWNTKHDIIIKGADVEIYIQDKSETHTATGLYSITNNKWIKKPEYTDPDVDDDDVKTKYEKWVYEINKIVKSVDDKDTSDDEYKDYFNRSEKLKVKLSKFRKKGLNDGEGEFSVENIVFKKLRNNGYIKKLYDASTEFYDSMFSQ